MERLQSKLEKIGRDSKVTAKSIGLRYSINTNAGYYRQRKNENFIFVDQNKKTVCDKQILERINKLVIPPKNQSDCKHKVIAVLDEVASKLGNTRTVCKKYYVHPTVIATFEKGTIWKYKPKSKNSELRPEECTLIELLQNESIAEVIC